MNKKYCLTLDVLVAFPVAALGQIAINPEYGTLATGSDTRGLHGEGLIVHHQTRIDGEKPRESRRSEW